ncbi:MAG: DNA polymerase III subunit delta [Dehalococcoidales bacterium]
MLYILSGPEDYSLTRSLEEIKKATGDPEALAAGTTTLDAQKITPDELRNICETVPFLTGKRLVIVKSLLERFEPGNRPRRPRKNQAASEQADGHKPYSAGMANLPDTTILVLIESKITSSNPLFKELATKATVKSFPLLREPKLREWVQKKVVEEDATISPQAVNLLVRLVGSNLWVMASEIAKLTLFVSGRRIEEEDVKGVVGYTQQTTVFTMVDAILEFKTELAEQSLQQLLQTGASPVYLLTMLTRQVRMMVRAREFRAQKKTNAEIMSKLGLTSEFIFRKTLEQAARYSLPRLREMYHYLLETDLAIKTGKYVPEFALTMLAGELSQRGKTGVTGSGARIG